MTSPAAYYIRSEEQAKAFSDELIANLFLKNFANGKTCFYQGFGLRQQYNCAGTYDHSFTDKN